MNWMRRRADLKAEQRRLQSWTDIVPRKIAQSQTSWELRMRVYWAIKNGRASQKTIAEHLGLEKTTVSFIYRQAQMEIRGEGTTNPYRWSGEDFRLRENIPPVVRFLTPFKFQYKRTT